MERDGTHWKFSYARSEVQTTGMHVTLPYILNILFCREEGCPMLAVVMSSKIENYGGHSAT